jgi:regulator of cell morphogenesis and NO signaling
MTIQAGTTVGTIAAEHPLSTRVFQRHGIDFCCGGGRPLGEVCEEKGIALAQMLGEIEAEISEAPDAQVRWDEEPLGALLDHILSAYHEPLKEELPRLEAMARKVHRVHGEKDPERLQGLLDTYLALKADLDQHMPKEEQILFPMIRSGQGAMAAGPISVMEHEHEAVGAMLRRLRELTDDYTVPAEACNTWRALWVGLADLERALHEHIHLENNVLHPRALRA